MATSPDEVLQAVQSGEYAPVYFLQGEESFYIDEISNYIEEHALDRSQRDFNQIILYGKETDIPTLLLNARRFPVMSERQTVIVKEAQEMDDLKKEDRRKLLEDYLLNPLPSTILLLCHKHKNIDGRTAFAKSVKKHTVFVESKRISERQLPDWILSYGASLGLRIEPEACRLLEENIGTNLERISNELKKISHNIGDDKKVSMKVVHKYVGINKDYNVFQLSNAIQSGDVIKANKIVNYFEANSKAFNLIPTVAIIHNLFARLLKLHFSKDRTESGLQKQLRVPPFILRELKAASNLYPPAKVIENLRFIFVADLQSKGVDRPGISDGQLLRHLVYQLTH